ncbi:alpha/beta fold hydrolase [Eubacteriaceae bacterium ES2]|nr:alpha/beta fold hydrolase [Eubacteriaceae bacterium ES2]
MKTKKKEKNKWLFLMMISLTLLLTGCAERNASSDENNLTSNNLVQHVEIYANQTSGKEAYVLKELVIQNEGMKIYGQLYLPENGVGHYPTVIIGHGFGGSYTDNIENARILAQAGYACYIFDFCGGSPYSSSDGSMLEMSVMTEVDDNEAVLEYIKSQKFVDNQNIFLMGESQGGLVAALTASDYISEIKGLILYYPAFLIPDNARTQYQTIEDIPDNVNIFGMRIGGKYYEDVFDLNVYDTINSFTKDVLIIHGDKDSIVPIFYSEKAVAAYRDAELITVQGAGHGFHGNDAEFALQSTIHYLKEHTDS